MKPNFFYHIYNRANGSENLFRKRENYLYFLRLWKKYIEPIAKTYVYCLLPNHFHFLIAVRNKKELMINLKKKFEKRLNKVLISEPSKGLKPLEGLIFEQLISLQFSHLFNAYTQAYNKMNKRKGSLFSPNFKRKQITSEHYLQQLIIYIHLNPVHHNIAHTYKIYPYSSYQNIISRKFTLLQRKEVIDLYDDIENLKYVHQQKRINLEQIKDLLLE